MKKIETIEYATGGGVIIRPVDPEVDWGQFPAEMLLLNRPKRDEIRLPKGHIDPGETPDQTALRETTEESGYANLTIMADLGYQKVRFEFRQKQYLRQEHYFLMRLLDSQIIPRPPNDENQFQRYWVSLSRATFLLTFEAEQAVAHRAIQAYRALAQKR